MCVYGSRIFTIPTYYVLTHLYTALRIPIQLTAYLQHALVISPNSYSYYEVS